MKKHSPQFFRRIAVCILILLLTSVAAVWAAEPEFYDTSSLAGKRVGTQSGSIYVGQESQYIKDPEVYYYANLNDMYIALSSNKVDTILFDGILLEYLSTQVDDLEFHYVESEPMQIAELAPKTAEGEKLISEYNAYIKEVKSSGELDKIYAKWFKGEGEQVCTIDYETLPDTNGTLDIGVDAVTAPIIFMENNKFTGYEIDMVSGFCQAYGYKPNFIQTDFSGIIAGVTGGKYDMGASDFSITEERKESVLFTEPIIEGYVGIGLHKESDGGFFSDLAGSFKKTFITDNRWQQFLSGCGVTLQITFFSILFGTILGLAVHILCRNSIKIAELIARFLDWLMAGIPVVVLLMILFYIVFASSSLTGTTVAIICFTFIFASAFRAMLISGENALDPGQTLAAEALGYTRKQSFTEIIMPQIVRHILPTYLTEVSNHLKATAVVGYIAVVDLTKVGDLIRGATYEAFFPLIAVAVLYFILAAILKWLVRIATRNTDPKRRTEEQILKGATL